MSAQRVAVYIDGFNLYFGIKSKFPTLKWLNVHRLSEKYLKTGQKLMQVKYFTSHVSGDPATEKRQRTYLDALRTTDVEIIFGHFKSKSKSCFRCKHSWLDNEEKMTDVNIATQMIVDALHDKYDVAILISGDSDLAPPITAVFDNFENKKVIVGFPPNRSNVSIKNVATASFHIGRSSVSQSQFPLALKSNSGYMLRKPTEWLQ